MKTIKIPVNKQSEGRQNRRLAAWLRWSIHLSLITLIVSFHVSASFAQDGQSSESESVATKEQPESNSPSMQMDDSMKTEMLRHMGPYTPRELYPSLMQLPELSPEKRADIEQRARDRMDQGLQIVANAQASLKLAEEEQDLVRMQEAAEEIRAGTAQYESGVAALRALEEGQAPREIALNWFRSEMNLDGPALTENARIWGMSPFHLLMCIVLLLFGAAMVWMYVLRMRRAAELLSRISQPDSAESVPSENRVSSKSELPEASRTKTSRWSGKLQVAAIRDETPNVKTFRLVSPTDDQIPFTFLPGQFLKLQTIGERSVNRAYTIASPPTRENYIEITVKREDDGEVSRFLHDHVDQGETLELTGPFGRFTFSGSEHDSVVLIGGGVGITPLMSIVRALVDTAWKNDIYFLYSCRSPHDFIFRDELKDIQQDNENLHLAVTFSRTLEDVEGFHRGRITREFIAASVPGLTVKRVYICGTPEMAKAIKEMLQELGVPQNAIALEAFGTTARAPQKIDDQDDAPNENAPVATFSRSEQTCRLKPQQTILEAAEEVGVEIDNACRSGTCGTCKVRLTSGKVTMEVEDALTAEDREEGIILACQARTDQNVVVEA
ncbi:2Fe-2S iron-sulfur cluster-binding protein [Rhodopirellula europaea]|uniref:2Fe-2S iron-sulfur cluster-binding protein n=1 Tax=Rhodopirellula europaea TaxID=1263866 RepID=UPI003D2A79E9|tara:strand:+ start:13745 stop:15580 length:1836 start_codon:yes stop_codon:yes gene_type:complete